MGVLDEDELFSCTSVRKSERHCYHECLQIVLTLCAGGRPPALGKEAPTMWLKDVRVDK